MTDRDGPLTRRRFLLSTAMAGLAGCPGRQDDSGTPAVTRISSNGTPTPVETATPESFDVPQSAVEGSHAPGPPIFTSVGEAFRAPEFGGVESNLAPRNPDATGGYAWSVVDAPDGSEADVGESPVVEFEPDVPGTYVLELTAPDGVHRQTIHAFPEATTGDPRPTLTLSGEITDGEAVVGADIRPPTDSDADPEDLTVGFLADDRDSFDGTVAIDKQTARLPLEALDDPVRVHAAAASETGRSVADTLVIDPAGGDVRHPTEPPGWATDAVIYEIFVRRFGIDVDFEFLESKVEYIDSMGADAVWLTPILDAHSHRDETQPGGPHGYDVIDYFQTADALGDRAAFESFVAACHDHGIRVIFDLVGNHTARQHPYFQAAKAAVGDQDASSSFTDWYRWDGGQAQYYFGWQGIPILNYDTPAVRSWFLAVVEEWADVVDGFRCDVAWGMPHSLWKEVRARVRRDHPEFLLLGEAVPWDADHADFAENEFGLHYDEGLYETLRAIGTGEAPADSLHDVVAERRDAGYPAHISMLNYVENHDTDRYLATAGEESQRAAGAATFTLPGAPLLYYGQETGLTGMREAMNWDSADTDRRSFYRALSDTRHAERALQSDADLIPLSVAPDDDRVTGYAREADGERVHVLLNFGADPVTVTQHPSVGRTDLLSGADVGAEAGAGVTVEDAVLLRADALAGRGAPLATFDDPTGDAAAPAAHSVGALDLTGLDVYETDDGLQFAWTVAEPTASDGTQFEVYLRDPGSGDGTVETSPGLDATLSAPAQYRVVVRPDGARVATSDGESVAAPPVETVGTQRQVLVPSRVLPTDPTELQFVTLSAPGGTDDDGSGESDDDYIADVLVGPGDDEGAVRSAEEPVLPMVPLATGVRNRLLDADFVAAWTDPSGDDHGPGRFRYPEADRWAPGTLDLTRVAVYAGDERYHWQFQFREPVPDAVDRSRLSQHLQVYLRDPSRSGGTAATRTGVGATLAAPHHRRLAVNKSTATVEAADGTVVSEDVSVTVRDGLKGLWVSAPRDALGDIAGTELAVLVLGSSLTGPGGVAQVQAERSVRDFGGRERAGQSNVVDMLVPEEATQEDVLAADDGRPTLPFVTVDE